MLDRLRRRRNIALQHILDLIDTAARTVEFVPEQCVGGACRGAKPTMNARSQNRIRGGDVRIGELLESKVRLHSLDPRVHPAGVKNAQRIEAFLDARTQFCKAV